MEGLQPEAGLVVRYDFLWRNEQRRGQGEGSKDRPCVVMLMRQRQADGHLDVYVCPITHTPPDPNDGAIEIPPEVARHLKLDDQLSWVTTSQLNVFTWREDQLPFGLTKTPAGEWFHGFLPPNLYRQIRDAVIDNDRKGRLERIRREGSGTD